MILESAKISATKRTIIVVRTNNSQVYGPQLYGSPDFIVHRIFDVH